MSDALKQAQMNVEMDMTPMIDCVFLLMIFFVLVIDLSQKNLEDLVLPKATYQEPDDKPPENRPILNILQNGAVVYKKTVVYNPDAGDKPDKILACLIDIRRTTKLTMKDEDIGGRKVSLVDDPILIRADKWTEWHYVGEVMKACSQPEAAFWKVELALSEEDKEAKRKRT